MRREIISGLYKGLIRPITLILKFNRAQKSTPSQFILVFTGYNHYFEKDLKDRSLQKLLLGGLCFW